MLPGSPILLDGNLKSIRPLDKGRFREFYLILSVIHDQIISYISKDKMLSKYFYFQPHLFVVLVQIPSENTAPPQLSTNAIT